MSVTDSNEEIYQSRNSERIWGIVKFNPNFSQLIYNEPMCVLSKPNRVSNLKLTRQDLSIQKLIDESTRLLKAPPAPRHGYSLYIRFDIHSKTKLFGGLYLIDGNLDLLKENFVLELTPSPEYFIEKVLDGLLEASLSENNVNGADELLIDLSNGLNDLYLFGVWVQKVNFKRILQIFIDSREFVSDNYFHHIMDLMTNAGPEKWCEIDKSVLFSTLNLLENKDTAKNFVSFAVVLCQLVIDNLPDLHEYLSEKLDFEKILDLLPESSSSYHYSYIRVLFFLWQMADEITFEQLKVLSSTERWVNSFMPLVESPAVYQNEKLISELSKICAGRMAHLTARSKLRPSLEDIHKITVLIKNISTWSQSSSYRISKAIPEFSLSRDWSAFENALYRTPPGLMAIEFMERAFSAEDQELFEIATKGPLCPEDWCVMMLDIISMTFKTMKNASGGMKLCPFFLVEVDPIPSFLKSLAMLFHRTWSEINDNKESLKNVLEITQVKVNKCLESYPKTVEMFDSFLKENFDSEFSRKELELLKEGRNDLENRWKKKLVEEHSPSVKKFIKDTYTKPLKDGLVLQRLPKDLDKMFEKESTKKDDKLLWRHWRLSVFDDILFYRDCGDDGRVVNGEKGSIRIDEIKHIIHGPEYLTLANMARFETPQGIFNSLKKKKSHTANLPKGLLIQTAEENFELICEDEEILGKMIKAFNILCFNKYPEDELQVLLNVETETRLLNLKVVKLEKIGAPKESPLPVPDLPKSYYDWIPKEYHHCIDPRKVLRLNGKKVSIPSFKKYVFELHDEDEDPDSTSSSDL
ncbi:unnamed protein product [Bursaphelenchus xylophilus]|uniref:(pine wood nematode) hypothetical protein n=1 Tax=Bursaphelenchus xylophilus TaxID=6326 RepID=A0A1I7SQ34_BURXY|nr:unnamed protein product [Bursaphelenchus xylophilus]CAG9109557.1 unnamed protein product [Bursaphelenchus xylophilus]